MLTLLRVSPSRYNIRAVPVLGYIAQLLPPPPGFETLGKKVIHRMLHLPFNSLGIHPLSGLPEVGGPRIRSVSAYSHACRLRTAVVTVTHWPEHLDLLKRIAPEFLPLARALSGLPPGDSLDAPPGWAPFGALWWPECWSSKPFCWYLAEAADLFPWGPAFRILAHWTRARRPTCTLVLDA